MRQRLFTGSGVVAGFLLCTAALLPAAAYADATGVDATLVSPAGALSDSTTAIDRRAHV